MQFNTNLPAGRQGAQRPQRVYFWVFPAYRQLPFGHIFYPVSALAETGMSPLPMHTSFIPL